MMNAKRNRFSQLIRRSHFFNNTTLADITKRSRNLGRTVIKRIGIPCLIVAVFVVYFLFPTPEWNDFDGMVLAHVIEKADHPFLGHSGHPLSEPFRWLGIRLIFGCNARNDYIFAKHFSEYVFPGSQYQYLISAHFSSILGVTTLGLLATYLSSLKLSLSFQISWILLLAFSRMFWIQVTSGDHPSISLPFLALSLALLLGNWSGHRKRLNRIWILSGSCMAFAVSCLCYLPWLLLLPFISIFLFTQKSPGSTQTGQSHWHPVNSLIWPTYIVLLLAIAYTALSSRVTPFTTVYPVGLQYGVLKSNFLALIPSGFIDFYVQTRTLLDPQGHIQLDFASITLHVLLFILALKSSKWFGLSRSTMTILFLMTVSVATINAFWAPFDQSFFLGYAIALAFLLPKAATRVPRPGIMLLCTVALFGINACNRVTKPARARMFHQVLNEFYKLDKRSLLVVGEPRSQIGAPWKYAWQREKIGVRINLIQLVGAGKDPKEAVNELKTKMATVLKHGHTVYVLDVQRFPDGESKYPNRTNAISTPLERFGITCSDLDEILLCRINNAQLVETRYFEYFPYLELRCYRQGLDRPLVDLENHVALLSVKTTPGLPRLG